MLIVQPREEVSQASVMQIQPVAHSILPSFSKEQLIDFKDEVKALFRENRTSVEACKEVCAYSRNIYICDVAYTLAAWLDSKGLVTPSIGEYSARPILATRSTPDINIRRTLNSAGTRQKITAEIGASFYACLPFRACTNDRNTNGPCPVHELFTWLLVMIVVSG